MVAVRTLVLSLLVLCFADAALAQPGRRHDPGQRTSNLSQEQRRQLRQDVDSARGAYQRPGGPKQDRMAPQEREQLRRDVQDANRDMRRR